MNHNSVMNHIWLGVFVRFFGAQGTQFGQE